MSTTRCRIPLGYFYGHLIVLPEEIPPELSRYASCTTTTDLQNQLTVLQMLFEDVSCRYSLSCSKLKELLHPFLMTDITNASHLSAYMDVMKDKHNVLATFDNNKIFNAYQEAITYQRQLNTVRNVMARIETAMNKSTKQIKTTTLVETCSDKLRSIAEALLEILLSVESVAEVDFETCQKLFQGLCVSQRSRVQFLAATLLDRSCRRKPFWGTFLADTLAGMFSSSYAVKFPQDRVFVLLAFLVKKSTDKNGVLDATLKVMAQLLEPLTKQDNKGLLAVRIDLPLLGWLLLFVSLQLDQSKSGVQNATRWDWVTGEMAGKAGADSACANYKKKIQKRCVQYKQHMENLEFNHKVIQNTAQVQVCIMLLFVGCCL